MLSLRPGKNSCAAVSPSKGTKIARNPPLSGLPGKLFAFI